MAYTLRQKLVPVAKYPLKCPNVMSPAGICVHNTANDASADGEISYMTSNALQTSFHIAIDDFEAVQGIPLDRNAWHAGDGPVGTGNRRYIAIEICYSKSGGEKFDKAEDNAAQLIAKLLKDLNLGIGQVKKHQDFSGKYCPHRTLDLGWNRFLGLVKKYMGATMPDETLTVKKSDWDRLLKASRLGDRLIQGLGYEGNIADKDENQIDLMVSANTQLKADVKNKQDELDKVPAKLDAAKQAGYQDGFKDGQATSPSNPTPMPTFYPTGKKVITPKADGTTEEVSYGVKQ